MKEARAAKAALSAVVTSATHSTVNVGGIAHLAYGKLKVKLDGYKPAGGEVFSLIKGGTIDGQFMETDYTEASLAPGLSWALEYKADEVLLKVTGQPLKLTISRNGSKVTVAWGQSGFVLQSATAVTGPWTNVETTGASYVTTATGAAKFFRLRTP